MKITLNALQYKSQSSGMGQFIYNLYTEMVHVAEESGQELLFDVITSKDSPDFPFKNKSFVQIRPIPYDKGQAVRRNVFELLSMGAMVDKESEVYFSLDAKLPLFMRSGLVKILAVTDLAVYRMGEVYQTSRTLYWKALFKRSISKADRIVAISEFTKKEIVEILGVDPDRISVIYTAASSSFRKIKDDLQLQSIRGKYGLHDPFLLFVGTFSPRKNLFRLIKAYETLVSRSGIPHKLVIVGEKGWKFNRETRLLQESPIADRIIFPGYIPDQDLSAIYNLADLTVFPSLYEGFGIPVIESMACGTPVALSNTSCLPEVAGDAGFYFNPYDVEEMAEKIGHVLQNAELRQQMITKGYERAKRYSWENSARQLLDLMLQMGKN